MIREAKNPQAWDEFLSRQQYRPFLQSWTMGEVYRELNQQPIRFEVLEGDVLKGICLAILVPARRGRHLSIPYGPVLCDMSLMPELLDALSAKAKELGCTFVRLSPHWPRSTVLPSSHKLIRSPLHLLSEEAWYLSLTISDAWSVDSQFAIRNLQFVPEEELFKNMRSTCRNLVRRAEKEGVTIEASTDPVRDLHHFIALHDETRKRHKFTPYTSAFFQAQVKHFAPRKEVTLYLAHYQGQVIAASIHMHAFGETSYHHGASASAFHKIPASYLLQWTAIRDALKRGDHIYNFWGIAPRVQKETGEWEIENKSHPFAGVTLFKTGFGGNLLSLTHCIDLPLSPTYHLTRAFEKARKWKRGF